MSIRARIEDVLKPYSEVSDLEYKLEAIKIQGREPEAARELRPAELYGLVAAFVAQRQSAKSLDEALTIVANALLMNEQVRGAFVVPEALVHRVVGELMAPSIDGRRSYLLFRMLFLCTFNGQPFPDRLVGACVTLVATKILKLADYLGQDYDQDDQELGQHRTVASLNALDRLALAEAAKTCFNLVHHYPVLVQQHLGGHTAKGLVAILESILPDQSESSETNPEAMSLFQHISNCLLCLPLDGWLYDYHYPEQSDGVLITILTYLRMLTDPGTNGGNGSARTNTGLTSASASASTVSLDLDKDPFEDRILVPALSLLHKITASVVRDADAATNDAASFSDPQPAVTEKEKHSRHPSSPTVDKRARHASRAAHLLITLSAQIFPSDKDRQLPLGNSKSLSSNLLRITTDPVLINSRNLIFDVLWTLCNEQAEVFVDHFGLGFASSFLASHGIAFPERLTVDSDSDALDTRHSSHSSTHHSANGLSPTPPRRSSVNPITGQFLDFERRQLKQRTQSLPEMTEDEKERDAERLAVLFERINAQRIFKVVNPMELAAKQN